MAESILRFENVSLAFEDVQALDGVSFDLPAGETRVILGSAGSGKTVLMKTALGLNQPDSGKVYLFGQEITAMPEKQLFPLRARVEVLNGYSAHADQTELRRWVDAVRAGSPALGEVALVHGEPPARDAFAATLRSLGYRVRTPAPGDVLSVP